MIQMMSYYDIAIASNTYEKPIMFSPKLLLGSTPNKYYQGFGLLLLWICLSRQFCRRNSHFTSLLLLDELKELAQLKKTKLKKCFLMKKKPRESLSTRKLNDICLVMTIKLAHKNQITIDVNLIKRNKSSKLTFHI